MIAIGSDHAGFPLKEEIKRFLDEKNIEYIDVGCYTPERFDYAISAQKACDKVVSGECDKAVLCCGTGVGISMAANKVKGIRACCCSDYFSAKYTRAHNDANVLCMLKELAYISEDDFNCFVEAFFNFSQGKGVKFK